MRLYVAAHFQDMGDAENVASLLESAGHTVVSDWHRKDENESELSISDKIEIAIKDEAQVSESEGLVLLETPHLVTGGKFVEAGICIGRGKPVFLLGKPENVMMYHPNVIECDSKKTMLYAIEDYINIVRENNG